MSDASSVVFLVVMATSIWVWIDAHSKAKNSADGRVGGSKPWHWFLGCLLLWIIVFPFYLVKRGQISKQPQATPANGGKPQELTVLEKERLLSQQEAERAECSQCAAALEERYKVTKDESLLLRIQALRAAADTVTTAAESTSRPKPASEPVEQERVRRESQAKWEARAPEDLLEEAQALTEQYKHSHDDALVPRIQALRRTAREREKSSR